MTTPRNLTTSLDALTSDAGKWSAASDDMERAHVAAQSLVLDTAQFGWVADAQGVVAAYLLIQSKLADLLIGASREFDNLAAELRDTAETYGRTDATNAGRLNDVDQHGQATIQEQPRDRRTING